MKALLKHDDEGGVISWVCISSAEARKYILFKDISTTTCIWVLIWQHLTPSAEKLGINDS